MNGTPAERVIYEAIEKVDNRVRSLERDGCGVRDAHDEALRTLHNRIDIERAARELMGEKFSDKMNAMRNQILLGMAIMLCVAIVLGKIIQ